MFKNGILELGNFLYRFRGIIAVPFFISLVFFSRPTRLHILPFIFLFTGLVLRMWTVGYIGPVSRQNKFAGHYIIQNGPYRFLKHPLYIGNFSLVVGVIFLFNPPIWLVISLIALFVVEYSIIILSEQKYLKNLLHKEAKFKLINLRGEISTVVVLIIIYLIYLVKLITST